MAKTAKVTRRQGNVAPAKKQAAKTNQFAAKATVVTAPKNEAKENVVEQVEEMEKMEVAAGQAVNEAVEAVAEDTSGLAEEVNEEEGGLYEIGQKIGQTADEEDPDEEELSHKDPESPAPSHLPGRPLELGFQIPAKEFHLMDIPGLPGIKQGRCFARVTDIPEMLDNWMEVNPRVPNRTGKGVLSGPVVRGITHTLFEDPTYMALKNQGIYLLVKQALHDGGMVRILLDNRSQHGIINGGHTYAAIRDAIETAGDEMKSQLRRAYVPLHLLTGVQPESVADIAEGLNRNKQVDDSSLANLQGRFRPIQESMHGRVGADAIAYHQGAQGDVDISDVLVFLEMFNPERFDENRHPSYLYSRVKSAQEFYLKDLDAKPSPVSLIVPHLPEILRLSDLIRKEVPNAAKRQGFEFGRMKTGKTSKRAKTTQQVPLPFLGESMSYKVPDGWLYPMLASFRANVNWDLDSGVFEWKVPLAELLPRVIDRLVAVCIAEHRQGGQKPDKVGKAESAYSQCYDKVHLYLLGADKATQGASLLGVGA